MNLYQLTGAALQLQNMLEAGEIDQSVYEDTLEGLDIDTKVENICKVIRNLEAQANAFKEEKDRLAERERVAKNSVTRLKGSLLAYMQTVDKKKVDAGIFTVSRSSSASVNVYDETALPEKYLVYQPAKVDKIAIAKDLKAGELIVGAEFTIKENVRIR